MDQRYQEIISAMESVAVKSEPGGGELAGLIDRLKRTLDYDDGRLESLVELMRGIAALDFEKRVPVTDDDSLTNAMAAGLNMLSEHLGRATVSTEFLASVLNTMKDGLLVVTPDGFIERINPALLAMLKCSPTDVLGTKVLDLFLTPAASGGKEISSIDELLEMDEALVRSRYGRDVTVLVSGSKLDTATGAGRVVLVIHDISERKKMESELEAARLKAEESTRMKTAFLSNMSHEIRTPLNAIIGFTDLLLSDSLTDSQRTQIGTVHKSGELLLNIIGEILDISRIEAGEVDIRRAPFSVAALLDNLDATGRILLAESEKPIELRRSPETDADHFIQGDEHRVTQIMNNMVVNAIKYTEAGLIEYGVSLEAPDRLRFFVSDTGMGIPPGEQEQVFELFRRGRAGKVRTIAGVGLGLAISRKLVRMMGGEMGLRSRVGPEHGSTFFFTIPFEPVEAAMVETSTLTQEIEGKDRKILLVEDDPDNRMLATLILKKIGFRVETAVNGQDAVQKFESIQDVELILMDVNMPVMDGLEATREIRKRENRADPGVPIIALTAHATEEQKEACLGSGCNDFVTKPIARERLIEKLNTYLIQGRS